MSGCQPGVNGCFRFAFRRGEVFCLLGANGAGKTTTINLFLNFIEPTTGTAMIKGLDVTKEPLETKRYIGFQSVIINLRH
jgi:ABC-2 type transport system ATP-binding protein